MIYLKTETDLKPRRAPSAVKNAAGHLSRTTLRGAVAVLLVLACLTPRISLAQYFAPTQAEWLAWPEYCRAKYVSGSGASSEFASQISQDEIASWAYRMQDVWRDLHHYCWGMSKVDRGMRQVGAQRVYVIKDALGDFKYFMDRVPKTHPLFADAAAQSCTALSKFNSYDAAMKYCNLAIETQPENGVGYMAKALALKRQRKMSDAIEVLEKGNTATKGESAEINYFLGLAYLDQKKYDLAEQHAKEAYRLGYPLPGLRDRLRAAGHPLN